MDSKQLAKIMIQIDSVLSHFKVIDFDYNTNRTIIKGEYIDYINLLNKLSQIKDSTLCIEETNYLHDSKTIEIEWTDETNEITDDDVEEAYKELKPDWDQDHIDMLKEYLSRY
jgi:hypothetical protein